MSSEQRSTSPDASRVNTNMTHPNAFFYQPQNDFTSYHIICTEFSLGTVIQILNNSIPDTYYQNEYHFYYQQQSNNRIYRVSCKIACTSFLNEMFYGSTQVNPNSVQGQSAFTPDQKENLKFNLTRYLNHYMLD